MKLNTISPAAGSKKTRTRVGRGASAGQGKTCGRGVKGQRARKGGYHKVGFEGGQMPLQRRLPKIGFRSALARRVAEVRVSELAKVDGGAVDLVSLKKANLVPADSLRAKIVLSGSIKSAVTVTGVGNGEPSRARCYGCPARPIGARQNARCGARRAADLDGCIKSAVTVTGVGVTKGARAAIEAAGGKVEAA